VTNNKFNHHEETVENMRQRCVRIWFWCARFKRKTILKKIGQKD